MHINRSVRRHARMTKRDGPTEDVLRRALVKRWEAVEPVGSVRREKRWRGGKALAGITGTIASDLTAAAGRVLAGKNNNQGAGNNRNGNKNGNGGGNGKGAATTTTAGTTSSSSSNSTSAGFSQVDLDAASSGSVSDASTPTANSSIGLSIEANDVGTLLLRLHCRSRPPSKGGLTSCAQATSRLFS